MRNLLLLSVLAACGVESSGIEVSPPCHGKCDATAGIGDIDHDGTSVCLALRGNGPRITAHFGAVARLFEQYGLVDGVAGGSSGSITAFLVESIESNPAVYRCSGHGCTATQAGERGAFLMKSMLAYFDVLGRTDEAVQFQEAKRLSDAIMRRGIPGLLSGPDPRAGAAALRALLTSPELRQLVNPELLSTIQSSPDPVFHARDLVAMLGRGASFEATDATMFVRPGAVNFPAFVDRIGRIGTFYAGVEATDTEAMARLLDTCAPAAHGKEWAAAASTAYDGTTCGARFESMIEAFRAEILSHPHPSRLDDSVGAVLPTLVTTAVLEGPAADTWRAARADYLAARPVRFAVNFQDVRIGYFGTTEDLATIEAAGLGRSDLKSKKRRALGSVTWRAALAASPAEPGLSRGVELAGGKVSVGGWSDLQPTLVLEDLGCDQVVYVTRNGGAGTFETGISNLLGIDAASAHALYALDDPRSSYYQALEAAGGVMCSDWDRPPVQDLATMTAIGYDSAFETQQPYFTGRGYDKLVARTGLPGCTLGVN